MVQPRKVTELVFAEPFVPLRIVTTGGRAFEVRHPEDVQAGRSTIMVYGPAEGDPDGPERWEKMAYTQIESIVPLGATARPQGV